MDTDFYFYEVEQFCPHARVTPLRPSDTSPDMGGVLKQYCPHARGTSTEGGGGIELSTTEYTE